MADWTYAPEMDASVSWGPAPTLITRLDDGKEIVREKHTNQPEEWTEEYKFDGAEFDAAKTFYDSKRNSTTFTKLSYDIYGTPTTERNVRFSGPFEWSRAGDAYFIVRLTFRRIY